MKKNKIISLSILGLLLMVSMTSFIVHTKAAPPAAYVGVAEEEYYVYTMGFNWADWASSGFIADGVSETLAAIFGIPSPWAPKEIYDSWVGYWGTVGTFSFWSTTVGTILPENQSTFLSDYFIFDNITHTPVNLETAYYYYIPTLVYVQDSPGTYIIVNDSASFALQSLYGGLGFSPMTLKYTVPFAPNNTNWATFAGWAQWGMDNYWSTVSPLTKNITVSALADGYSMYIPTAGLENNTAPITVNVTYTSKGALDTTTFEYGSSLLYVFELDTYSTDGVDPVIIDSPGNFTIDEGYTGESLSWTATDAYAGNYTITRDATPVVTTTNWTSGTPVVYNIPDGLLQGVYTFTIDFQDTSLQSTTDVIVLTVAIPDTTDPVITSTLPSDLVINIGEYGDTLSWTANDTNPGTYTISRNGTVIVGPTTWVSGTPVTIDVEYFVSYSIGVTTYEVIFYDFIGNNVSDSVTVTVNPIPTTPPPGIPGFEPLIVIGIFAIGTIGLIVLKKKRK